MGRVSLVSVCQLRAWYGRCLVPAARRVEARVLALHARRQTFSLTHPDAHWKQTAQPRTASHKSAAMPISATTNE